MKGTIWVGLFLSQESRDRLSSVDHGTVKPDDFHTTLVYVGKSDDYGPEKIRALREAIRVLVEMDNLCGEFPPSVLTSLEVFNGTAWHRKVSNKSAVDQMMVLRRKIEIAFKILGVEINQDFEFTPHVTVSYKSKPSSKGDRSAVLIRYDRLRFYYDVDLFGEAMFDEYEEVV